MGAILANLLLPNLNTAGTSIVLIGALILGILASTTFTFKISSAGSAGTDEDRPVLWTRFREWRERRKSVRTVVNIKPSGPRQWI